MGTPRVLRLTPDNRDDILKQAADQLAAGGLVCVPTETVYGVGGRANDGEAVHRLRELKGGDRPFTLHVSSVEAAFALGHATPGACRLARSYWPGPLTMVLTAATAAKHWATHDGTIGVRVVAHEFTTALCDEVGVPLLLTSANEPGAPPATNAEAAAAALGESVDLIVDAGPCEVGRASSVVRIKDGKTEVLRDGALAERRLFARAAALVLFVCSGNTCRSPMAEVVARARWAAALGVERDRLVEHGILVASAGISAFPGMPATDGAQRAVSELGLDLEKHRSRPLEASLLARASHVFCMGTSHLHVCERILEDLGGQLENDVTPPRLLAGGDLPDPFGGDLEDYRVTRDAITNALPRQPPTVRPA